MGYQRRVHGELRFEKVERMTQAIALPALLTFLPCSVTAIFVQGIMMSLIPFSSSLTVSELTGSTTRFSIGRETGTQRVTYGPRIFLTDPQVSPVKRSPTCLVDFAQFLDRLFGRQPGASGAVFHSRRLQTQCRA